ncbi:unnamed protein product [Spirodela intermedia]|uniref:Uncharacterized protein n=1 Tax=Spirodela intermedia TaxID=51605 RepID=A0ABN7E9K0_SPIIN|nr:unnamed protein product [Spirodela intermedia]
MALPLYVSLFRLSLSLLMCPPETVRT